MNMEYMSKEHQFGNIKETALRLNGPFRFEAFGGSTCEAGGHT